MPSHSTSDQSAQAEYFIGLMSGTSVDAMDAALVAFNHTDHNPKLHALHSQPIPKSLQAALLDCNQAAQISLAKLCELHAATGKLFAQTVNQLLAQQNLPASHITAIGSHGQTIFHHPEVGMSLQIGHPALIAKHTGIQTVGDFRVDDMALGGQGAPFAPAFHQYLFAEPNHPALVVNIGGIANLSFLPAGQHSAHAAMPKTFAAGNNFNASNSNKSNSTRTTNRVSGFDSGPGNGLMDEACQRYFDKAYDKNGAIAAAGKPDTQLLKALLEDDYFAKPAPKSTGRDYFNWSWLQTTANKQAIALEHIAPEDLLATLTELTALSITNEVLQTQQYKGSLISEAKTLWVCGGGAFNQYLLSRLQQHLPDLTVCSSLDKQVNPVAIEAMLFAWLAKQRIEHRPVNLQDVTGANRNAILGGIWEA